MAEQWNLAELVQPSRVHRSIYVESQIFELEMQRIFESGWVYLGHESEVAAPGDYKTVRFGTQPAIMIRDENENINVVMNRCMHRGASICQQERGNTPHLRCWYHGWTYNNRGELVGVPYAAGFGKNFDRRKFALIKPARVSVYRGLVFGSLTPDVPELTEYLGKARYFLDLFMDLSPEGVIEARAGTHKYGYDGNWKFQMENGVDGYHANFVHQSFFEVQGKKLGTKLMRLFAESSPMESKDLGNGHSILDTSPKRQVARPVNNLFRGLVSAEDNDRYLASLIKRFGEERTSEILGASNVNLAIFPNLLIIGVQLRQVNPVRVDRTDVYATPTTLRGVPEPINVARLRAHESFYGPAGGGAPDDVEMFNRCTEGLRVKAAEWLELSRGLERETESEDGVRSAHLTDETPQRAFYRKWRALMVGEAARPDELSLAAAGS
jgi:anthranilate 1,2-dioxygenase (deaminating, decarboxylating) large subunit